MVRFFILIFMVFWVIYHLNPTGQRTMGLPTTFEVLPRILLGTFYPVDHARIRQDRWARTKCWRRWLHRWECHVRRGV